MVETRGNPNAAAMGKKYGGRNKGSKNKTTLAKEKALQRYEDDILRNLKGLTIAQLSVAIGVNIMMVKDRKMVKGKWEDTGALKRVTDPDKIIAILEDAGMEEGNDYHWIFAKDPNPRAIEDTLNRILGKPKDTVELGVTKTLADLVQSLMKK